MRALGTELSVDEASYSLYFEGAQQSTSKTMVLSIQSLSFHHLGVFDEGCVLTLATHESARSSA